MHQASATYFDLIFNFIFIFRFEVLLVHVTKTKITPQIKNNQIEKFKNS